MIIRKAKRLYPCKIFPGLVSIHIDGQYYCAHCKVCRMRLRLHTEIQEHLGLDENAAKTMWSEVFSQRVRERK